MVEKTSIHKKIEMARQELLDLGLRNPLLNYRTLKARGVEIVREKPSDIYRILVSEKRKMTFEEAGQNNVSTDSKLQTNYTAKQLESRLLNTYYNARTYIEEQGVNILYMALGMLHWYESDSSHEVRTAPLILVPVQLDRVSARERFTVAYTEDEIGHNISLAAKMKAEFSVDIPSLPEDEELDIDQYFSDVKNSIEGIKGWSVDTDFIVIGFFSFGKFLMFRDLDVTIWPDHARPEEHPVITALLEDGFKEGPSQFSENDHIDQHLKLGDAKHVMNADSSQIMAILDAKQGRNMVIQGPPGTGKSQTITNLIAEAMGDGKKVLFVSEKMAALEVVKRRLDSVGLGVACLELHSHKTNKKALLNELATTLDLGKPKYNDNGNINLLEDLRSRLNQYCAAVNSEVGQTGVSPYQAIGELVRYQLEHKEISFPKVSSQSMDTWGKDAFKKREALIEELQNLIVSIGPPVNHSFWGSKKKIVLPAEIEELRQTIADAKDGLKLLVDSLQAYASEIHYPLPKKMLDTLALLKVLERVNDAPDVKGIHLKSENWLTEADTLTEWINAGIAYTKIHDKYEMVLLPEAWDQDLLDARQFIVQYQHKWWKFISGDYRKAKSKVLGLCRNPKDKSLRHLEIVDSIMEARRHKDMIMHHESLAKELFSAEWRGVDSKWDRLTVLNKWLFDLHKDVQSGELPEWIFDFLSILPDKTIIQGQLADLDKKTKDVSRSIVLLEESLEFNGSIRFENNLALVQQDYSTIMDLLSMWLAHVSKLQEIASYNNLVSLCEEEELQPFIELSKDWERSGEYLIDCFRWNWYQAIVSNAFHERQALANFDSSRHEHAIQKFRELDRYLAELNRAILAEEHWRKLPQYEAGGQLGVLRREFEKKTRHLPIRQLMLKAGHAIQAIKPIFMMGPLSIATYLQPGSLEFDLVIFDEASQVKPVDAFGAIIRAKQAIVVGDSKQMPPTNFFDSIAKEEGDDENFVADMESVLGLFMGQNAPQRMLRWHYRSRHESLITVSNHEFYDNKLVVFPSPDADRNDSGLIYNYLHETHYDRGRSRTNKLEAKAVAQAVMEHAALHPNLTLGVAAFSTVQMQAVMDELEILRRANPSCESFFTAHLHEPFFVKNLENVQGDERDVIFISIGYGKTSEGYLAMDFGPLNREGGERRLNVLISRARIRCEVFTNLRSDDIDLNRSNARGVKALKTFLKYAESGNLDVPSVAGKGLDSPFEEAVCKSLVDLGYEVKPQVGSAGFFVDLAIVDPDSPGKYVLGIECDGVTYHSARSARDRDRLREEVLASLGWNIHRIWSTDWFRHPERELKRVVEAIEKAKIHVKMDRAQERKREKQSEHEILRDDKVEKEPLNLVIKYQLADLNIDLGGKEFHNFPLSIVASWVYQVVQVESPVHISEVMKRVCDALGIKRVGSRIQEVFEQSFLMIHNVNRKDDFLWLKDMKVPKVRDRSEVKTNKKVDFISREEIQESLIKVVRDSCGIQMGNVHIMCGQLFGFTRVSDDFRAIILELIDKLVHDEILIMRGDTLVIRD